MTTTSSTRGDVRADAVARLPARSVDSEASRDRAHRRAARAAIALYELDEAGNRVVRRAGLLRPDARVEELVDDYEIALLLADPHRWATSIARWNEF